MKDPGNERSKYHDEKRKTKTNKKRLTKIEKYLEDES